MVLRFTPEQKEYIRSNYEGKSNTELTASFNEFFGLDMDVIKIKTFKKNNRLNSGLTGRFGVERKPTGIQYKNGHMPHNSHPVGTEKVNGHGYVEVKIADPKYWKPKHVLVWEEHHQKQVPDGHVVIFGDGDNRNFTPDNLLLVTRGQLVMMNTKGLIKNDVDLTRTGIILADIGLKINQLKNKRRGGGKV
ncbi:HNH endonuclease signature motif containing protein [Paenibacillus sp. JDR-2]|uniref:HNH endonuclease signature motif containing protein n=1 Tax=Paenibacillus sp. (strain JDR-2) TaxID=324057 RepID=UPI000166A2E4|nr:HNH endonuclease signature motif containing protein [Paenibacillus sp. JDR-2]ACT00267.1 conserved hypothetical protein [Paenibacillus sp. JDR-2]